MNATDGAFVSIFSGDNLDKLQSIMYPKRMKVGTYLFWEGEETGKLYYIRSGRVKLRKTTEEGKDMIFSILQKGDLIGDVDGYGDSFHSYSAEVIEDADIGIIQQRDLEIILYQHGDFAIQFMKWMGLTHRTTQSKFRDLLLFGKTGALASTLIRMSNTYGVMCADGIRLELQLTNTEMADLIGATRESVNRMLCTLKDEGTITITNGQIFIQHLDALRRTCNCPTYPACPKEICRL
jgi:CRP/FNR family transcriptional regulator